MCMSLMRKVKQAVLPRLGSRPFPLLAGEVAENAACCRCTVAATTRLEAVVG